MEHQSFYATYVDAQNDAVFTEQIDAPSYWDACTVALANMPKGAADFDMYDPTDSYSGKPPSRVVTRKMFVGELRGFVERRQEKEPQHQETNGKHTTLVFGCVKEEDLDLALYRLVKRDGFTGTTADSIDTLIARGMKHRRSPSHRYLVGLDPSTGNAVMQLDLDVQADIFGIAQRQ